MSNKKKQNEFYLNPGQQYCGFTYAPLINNKVFNRPLNMHQLVQNTHAELCPVCNGSGVYTEYCFARGQSTGNLDFRTQQTCHGCGGKGWVVIGITYGIR